MGRGWSGLSQSAELAPGGSDPGTGPAHPPVQHRLPLCTSVVPAEAFSCQTEHTLPVSFYFGGGLLTSRAFCSRNFLLKYFI